MADNEEFKCVRCGVPKSEQQPGDMDLCPECREFLGPGDQPPELTDEDERILDRIWDEEGRRSVSDPSILVE